MSSKRRSVGRERLAVRLTAEMNRISLRPSIPLPHGRDLLAFHAWVAMTPLNATEAIKPDPQFDNAIGIQIVSAALIRERREVHRLCAPGPIIIGPHALSRLFDRHGARTVADAMEALEALYRLVLRLGEREPLHWAIAGALHREARVLLPGPCGGAWAVTPRLNRVVGVDGPCLMLLVRSFLDAGLLDERQHAEVAHYAAQVVPDGSSAPRAAHHLFAPGHPIPVWQILEEVAKT
jgi:hypothetical protein